LLDQCSIEIIITFLTLLGETAVPEGKSRLEKNRKVLRPGNSYFEEH
jgi:hypothetical protein